MFMEDIQVCVLGISTMVSTQISFSLINQANKTKHFIAVARLGALSPSLRPSYSYMTYRKCSGNTPPPNHIWYWKRKNGLPCLDSIPPFKSQTLTEGIRLPDLSSVAHSSVRRLYIKRGKSCHVERKSPFIRQYWRNIPLISSLISISAFLTAVFQTSSLTYIHYVLLLRHSEGEQCGRH